MAVISCANCGAAVNAAASGCPQCGADPRTGEGAPPADEQRAVPYAPIPARKLILAGFACALAAWLFWLLAWLAFWYSPLFALSAAAVVLVPIVASPAALVCTGFGVRNAWRHRASFWVYPLAAVSVVLAVANLAVFVYLTVLLSGPSVLSP